jgi:hypothetical protein
MTYFHILPVNRNMSPNLLLITNKVVLLTELLYDCKTQRDAFNRNTNQLTLFRKQPSISIQSWRCSLHQYINKCVQTIDTYRCITCPCSAHEHYNYKHIAPKQNALYQYTFHLIWLLHVAAGRHLQGAHNQADSNKFVSEDGDRPQHAADR